MKIMIIGGAGMLGHQIWLECIKNFGAENVACTLRKSKKHYESFKIFNSDNVFDNVDFLNFESSKTVLQKFKPDVIINCIGLTLRKSELSEMEKCLEINALLPHRLAKWGQQNNCRVIHFSTDCVFDGTRGNYSESDIPTAEDLYGKSKFLGEISYPNSLTLRLSIVGRELEGKTELLEWFLSQKGKSIKGYAKALYSGLSTITVSKEVCRLIAQFPSLSGVYQLASEPITKYDLLCLANDIFMTNTKIEASTNYISDKTLSSKKYAEVTGFQVPKWKNMLVEMKNSNQQPYGEQNVF